MTSALDALMQASGVIFDVDGTLVDSVDFHAEAWQRTFAAFGIDVPVSAIRSQIGKGGDQLMPVFLPADLIERQGAQIEAHRKALFTRDYMEKVCGFSGVPDLFRRLRGSGQRIALGSSASGDELNAYKQAAGIGDLTDVETTSDDAERSKPHPDIFTAALQQLRLPASAVVVVGDTPYDIEAANKAGMRSIALLCGGFPEADLMAAGALAVFRDPADLLWSLTEAASASSR